MLKGLVKSMMKDEHWQFLSWYRSRFGFPAAIAAYLKMRLNNRIGEAPNSLDGGSVFIRPGTADQDVYDEIFVSREYALDLGSPSVIVDAGAHIGLASAFMAGRYPHATVISIEPEPTNFRMLQLNSKQYQNIRPVQAGLWSRKANLRIEDTGVSTWAFRVTETDSTNGIPALGIPEILEQFGLDRIDVLKIDIEGSEVEVLDHSAAWMDRVGAIIIELHDRFRPGCTEALERALNGFSFERSVSGESIVIRDLRKK